MVVGVPQPTEYISAPELFVVIGRRSVVMNARGLSCEEYKMHMRSAELKFVTAEWVICALRATRGALPI
jgi:hypothetical protein